MDLMVPFTPGDDSDDESVHYKPWKPLTRSGSVTDIDLSMKNREIFKLGFDLIRKPLPQDDLIFAQNQRRRRRFVCGHPGCGKAFTNLEVVKEHQKSHNFW